jgi:hypothetical protein
VTVRRKPKRTAMSRRTEIAYKAESLGESVPHDEAPDSVDTVDVAVASRKLTFLSEEI